MLRERKIKQKKFSLIGLALLAFTCVCSPKIKQESVLGYRIENNEVVFEFDKTQYSSASQNHKKGKIDFSELKIDQVAVSGEFNGWSQDGWRMVRINENIFQLRKKLSDFEDKMSWQYKFIINENYWVEPPHYIKNRIHIYDPSKGKEYENMLMILPSLKGNTVFKLKGFNTAEEIYLSGSFNNWDTHKHKFGIEKGEWVCRVNLDSGKHFYKFIVDGHWMIDPANPNTEYDRDGNLNSVLYITDEPKPQKPKTDSVLPTNRPLTRFELYGFAQAKNVVLTGSFDSWSKKKYQMERVDSVWKIDLPLPDGKFEYKFLVDGNWMRDPKNPVYSGFPPYDNSVITVGKPDTFRLEGFKNANKVVLSGTFVDWSENKIQAKLINGVWLATVFLESGKHHYKFIVDGEWILDPKNPLKEKTDYVNSVYFKGNTVFEYRLPAQEVFLTGTFNQWEKLKDKMVFDGKKWIYKLNLLPGVYSYRFWVDGKAVADPKNPQQDAFGNSVLKVE
jgi:hypothetical protein